MAAGANPNAGHRKRLKQRFLKTGLQGFHDYEMLELLLTNAIPRRDVKPLAKELVKRFKGLKGIFEAGYDDLLGVNGIGGSAAAFLMLLKEVSRAYLNAGADKKSVIRSPKDAVGYFSSNTRSGAEGFLVIYLNSKNEALGLEALFSGGMTGLDPRGLIEGVFRFNARSVIFIQNMPGLDRAPYDGDCRVPRELIGALKGIEVILHDHIVITGAGGYFSARDAGMLNP